MTRPRLVVVLSKDPTVTRAGDMEMNLRLLELAREVADVSVVCLSEQPDRPAEPGLTRVPKPVVRRVPLLLRSFRRRRSLVFTRFDTDELVATLDATPADVVLAVHLYMAESVLRSVHAHRGTPVLVTAVVSEAAVWAGTRGVLGRLQAPLVRRDERRVVRAAAAVGAYDEAEAEQARRDGARSATWLPLVKPSRTAVDVARTPPRLLLLGDRTWGPNQQAFETALRWWPAIADGVPGAELVVVGKRSSAERVLPPGVRDLGFVDDLDALLATCRALLAPVSTGGGVRVKLLDAAAVGLPVVATSVAIGSLGTLLPVVPHDDETGFVAAARRLLLDADAAGQQGRALHRANADVASSGRSEAAFATFLAARATS